MKSARDCKYFKGNEPCVFHKLEGSICRCGHYRTVGAKILIIQLGEMGDVIRTTPILRKLKDEYPYSDITWITSYPGLLPQIVDNILEFNERNLFRLQVEEFDLLLNFDKSKDACVLSTVIKAKKKKGFILTGGKIAPADKDADFKFEMGLNDTLSRKCKQSFPEQIFKIAGYKFKGEKYLFPLGINKRKKIIGLNTGCGEKWAARLWGEKKWIELAKSLKQGGYEVILLGGKSEHQRNLRIAKSAEALYPGYYPIQLFSVLVSFCDLIVTVPTMALHVAIALDKKIILLNNVFNKNEFELYGLGEIIAPKFDCVGCYRNYCEKNCLDTIEVKRVVAAIGRLMKK